MKAPLHISFQYIIQKYIEIGNKVIYLFLQILVFLFQSAIIHVKCLFAAELCVCALIYIYLSHVKRSTAAASPCEFPAPFLLSVSVHLYQIMFLSVLGSPSASDTVNNAPVVLCCV